MTEITVLSSLSKIFPDEICNCHSVDDFTALKNENISFQLAIKSDTDTIFNIKINSDISDYIIVCSEKYIPSNLAGYPESNDYIIRNNQPGEYPDCLIPCNNITCKKDEYTPLWFEIKIPENANAGKHKIEIILDNKTESNCVSVNIEIINTVLKKQYLKCTHWFHTDCLATYYNVEVFSEEYWRIVENFMLTARQHGINMILTPLFTPPLDTKEGGERPTVQLVDVTKNGDSYTFGFEKLERWVTLCNKCGIEYFEMSHLFTQWGAKHAPKIMATTEKGYKRIFGWETGAGGEKYDDFIRRFSVELNKFIKKHKIEDRCYFHVSDEPSITQLVSYRKASKLIKECFGQYKHIDALGDYSFYKRGYVDTPVPNENCIEKFYGKVPELWTYYCCGQCSDHVPNRFFAMPSLRNRILGILMYKYNIKGFLQWGYNFWYSQYSVRQINPYKESDAGKAFPSGDAYVVYPAPDGTAYASLRFKVFFDAIQDMTALIQLEEKIGRENVILLIEKDIQPLTFNNYPHSEQWLFELRNKINEKLNS